MRLSLIVAKAENGVIGQGGKLPWHLPADLKRFKAITWGHTILMGRKTHESIGRLLPGRRTVILTRDPTYTVPGATVAPGLSQALAGCAAEQEVFVVGGQAVYAAALPLAARIYLTQVHEHTPGDVYFPPCDESQWRLTSDDWHAADAAHPYAFSFRILDRLGESPAASISQ